MEASIKHIRYQLPVLGTMGKIINRSIRGSAPKPIPKLPSKEVKETIPPRPRDLVCAFIRYVGGNTKAYQGLVPFHLFPQWTLPLGARLTADLPYDFTKVINASCKVEINGPLRIEEPLQLTGRLEKVDDNGRRALVTVKIVTETSSSPNALVVYQTGLIMLKKTPTKKKKPIMRVPTGAELIDTLRLSPTAGLDYALLTGDFNPLHWLPFWARTLGFKAAILHGYASMSKAVESLTRVELQNKIDALKALDIKFTAPLYLPGKAGVFIDPADKGSLYVGSAAGGKAYLKGHWQ